jgi:hypothetical protein
VTADGDEGSGGWVVLDCDENCDSRLSEAGRGDDCLSRGSRDALVPDRDWARLVSLLLFSARSPRPRNILRCIVRGSDRR